MVSLVIGRSSRLVSGYGSFLLVVTLRKKNEQFQDATQIFNEHFLNARKAKNEQIRRSHVLLLKGGREWRSHLFQFWRGVALSLLPLWAVLLRVDMFSHPSLVWCVPSFNREQISFFKSRRRRGSRTTQRMEGGKHHHPEGEGESSTRPTWRCVSHPPVGPVLILGAPHLPF